MPPRPNMGPATNLGEAGVRHFWSKMLSSRVQQPCLLMVLIFVFSKISSTSSTAFLYVPIPVCFRSAVLCVEQLLENLPCSRKFGNRISSRLAVPPKIIHCHVVNVCASVQIVCEVTVLLQDFYHFFCFNGLHYLIA